MKLNTNKAAFGQHETFPMRYGWMTKGVEALTKSPDFFAKPEEAMIELGIGSNMVRALQYWLRVTGIARFDQGEGIVTPLGEALIGDKGDQYLEDEATLWIIHWLIASNAELATGFFWFFNHYAIPRFQDKDALQALSEFVASELKTNRSLSTLKSDISTLLRMYAPVTGKADEHLDSTNVAVSFVVVVRGGSVFIRAGLADTGLAQADNRDSKQWYVINTPTFWRRLVASRLLEQTHDQD